MAAGQQSILYRAIIKLISPFARGELRGGEHLPARGLMVGEALYYDPAAPRKAEECGRLIDALSQRVAEMYAALEG